MRWLCVILIMIQTSGAAASKWRGDFSGYAAVEGTWFVDEPLFPEQNDNAVSFLLQPEYRYELEDKYILTIVPFARYDSADKERSHLDMRELNLFLLSDRWELRVGIAKVFWGVTEFYHLVDIINQTDLVENIDQEDKLGQPMVNVFTRQDWGNLDFYLMPWFRERTFPGSKGRLRLKIPVSTDRSRYESGAAEHHMDLSLRYSNTFGDWDVGLYHFKGTGREPELIPEVDESGRVHLIPYYYQIDQTGVDVLWAAGEWLWKLEALYRTGGVENFYAFSGGFEYTIPSVNDSLVDIGLITEWAYDDRNDAAPTPFENVVMFGLRLAFNDFSSTELLLGWIKHLDSSASYATLEASRRFGNHVKATIEGRAFLSLPPEDPLYSMRQDDHLKLTLYYYF